MLVFAVILLVILFSPLLFNRLGIPGILGLILSGVLLGPHGLGVLERDESVVLFSTIGLLYIMFIAGLELDLAEFRKNKNKSIVFGFLTFIIPLSLGVPVCYYLLDYNLSTSFLTASMFSTHTLIAYPIVNRLGISKNEAVAVAVGGTILTDTAVLILLAVISGSRESGLTNTFWTGLGVSLLIFILIVIFIIPKIASWFFKRMEDEKYAHFIFVLSVVFFTAFLAELAGLEPIIGAFAAGLTLNRLIPHASTLMNRIEFVGNSLFIPFFLISVGMLIDVSVLTNGLDALIIALILIVVAISGKWFAAKITGTIYKYRSSESNLIFGLSSAHAAATLAVILVGYNIGLIDDHLLNGTIVLILITCVVASFVTEQAGKKLVIQMDKEPEKNMRSQRLLIPIANPETMERLLDFGIMLKNHKEHSPIVAMSVVKDDDQAQEKLLQSRKLLDKAIIHAASADQKIEIMATIDRNVTSGIKRSIKENFITDVILGWSAQKNLADIIFGRTFDSLVKQSVQTIFITRFVMPLNIQRRLILICPVFAEKESGFYNWLTSVTRLSLQLQIPINLYAEKETFEDIHSYFSQNKFSTALNYRGSVELAKVTDIRGIETTDLIVLVSSRPGGISYTSVLDILPRKIAKRFAENNLVFIYPETEAANSISNFEQEITGGMIEKSVSILKNASRIFKRD